MDFLKIMRILRDAQYPGAFCPDLKTPAAAPPASPGRPRRS
jgi:hypothetical protein